MERKNPFFALTPLIKTETIDGSRPDAAFHTLQGNPVLNQAGKFLISIRRRLITIGIIISCLLLPCSLQAAFHIPEKGSDLVRSENTSGSVLAHQKYSTGFSSDNFINSFLPLPAPVDGDYQTRATGNWNSNATWQVRTAGIWVNCLAGDYPGVAAGAGTVWINSGHVVTANVSPANPVAGLTFVDGSNAATTVILTGRTLNVTGTVTFGTPANAAGTQTITLGTGTLNCAAVYMPNIAAGTNDVITVSTGTLTVSGNIQMDGTSSTNNITYSGAGALNVAGNFIGGGFTCSTGTVTYTGTVQQVGAYTYNNLVVQGGNTKTLGGAVSVGGALTLTSGVVRLGAFDLTLTNTTAIGGSPFNATKMIETNGAGHLIRSANVTNQSFNTLIWPVGSNGYYNEFIMSSLPNGAGAARSFSIRAVPSNPGALTIYMNKYWDITATNITTQNGTVLSFAYNSGEIVGDPTQVQLFTTTSGSWAKATGASAAGSNPSTSTYAGASTITGSWTVGAPGTYYSYQSGNWDQASTWTFDPGGTTGPGVMVPGLGDKVVILAGRTVSLASNTTTQNLDVTINTGGILDLSTFKFSNGLTALRGSGTLKLSSASFPNPVTTNTFVTTDGGTTEYDAAVTMPATQSTYYHLTINSVGTVVMTSNITLNGNLLVKQGTFQINDATSQRLQLIINGDVTVNSGTFITVGTGVTNTVTSPLGINGTTNGFQNYYELHSHRVQVYGNFTNNGTVRFTNLSYPIFNSFPPLVAGPTTGFATVYFNGLADKALTCNGTTDFYNLVLDKGTDQTFKLTIYSSAYADFRLFGANVSAGDATAPASNANPNLKKALWVRNGTLILQGLTVIPSLSEGATAGPPSSDFTIPSQAAVIMDGAGVIVLSTADDYREVNGAYGVAAPDNATMGVNTSAGNSGISILGKLQINDGYLSTRESGGILYWPYAPGQFVMNGGTLDSKQFHSSSLANSLIAYTQTGGLITLRGRFQRTTSTYTPVGLVNAPLNNVRATGGIDAAAGSLSITNSGGNNGFAMSGGTIRVYDVCGTVAPTYALQILPSTSDINVTGGSVEILPTSGSVPANDADYLVYSTAPFGNLLINTASGTKVVQLNTLPLTVLSNLNIAAGVLNANNLDVTVGGDFTVAAGTTYTAGTNTTTLNGTGSQNLSIYAAQAFNNLTLSKSAGVATNFAGTTGLTVTVSGNLRNVLGTLNDNGNSILVAGSLYNSGTTAGTGKISLNGTLTQTIDGNGIFGNLELNNTNASAAPVSLIAAVTVNGNLTFSQNKIFNIGTYNLKLNGSATIVNGTNLRYIQSAGNNGDGGVTKVFSSTGAFLFPMGVVNYTPATITVNSAPTAYGSVTVVPVNYAQPNETTAGRSLSYYWHVSSSGFTLGGATVTHSYTYDQSNVVTGAGITENEYVPARFNNATMTWSEGTLSDINIASNIIGDPNPGTFLKNVTFIDGDYTAGDNNPIDPFGSPRTLYSRQTGLWSNVSSWSLTSHTVTNPPATVPGANDIVLIGGNDSIYLTTNPTTADVGKVSCATLQIEKGSALDVGYNPGSNFARVINCPTGNGNFRVTTNFNSPSTYSFPSGDFSDYNINMGTTELYTTNNGSGTTYYLPNNVATYGNLILSPLGGSNVIFGNLNVTIYGDLITRGQNADSWFLPTWGTTYPGPVTAIAKTITINGKLDIQGGALMWYNNGATAENIVVGGDVKVGPLCGLYVYSGGNNQAMTIGGSLINNANGLTNAPASTQAKTDFTGIPLTFNGSNPASITSTTGTPLTIFSTVTVNKGASPATTLTCDIGGTLTTPANAWLTLTNGTFRYMRTDPNSDFTISTTTPFTIPSTAGLYINLPSNSGNRNILIGNNASDNGDLLLQGALTIINGNVYVGRPVGTDNNNNDIEYSTSGSSAINISGGLLFVNGQIRRNPSNASGILKYRQTGGTVTVNGQNFVSTNAKFEIVNTGSVLKMTGGTLTIVRGNGATTTPSSTYGDLYLRPDSSGVTGGSIIFAHAGVAAPHNYFIDATVPLYNLTITGVSAANYSTVRILASPLTLNGDLNINANSVLNANNINTVFNGNFVNTPGAAGYVPGTNTTTFSASNASSYIGAQTLTGVTSFYDMVVSPGTSLTLSAASSITINDNLTISSGSLICGANTVNLKGNLTDNASFTDNNAAGNGITLNGTVLQHIAGTGSFARLSLNNTAGAICDNDISVTEDLTLTSGILNIQKNVFTLGLGAGIQGSPFSVTKMIITDGVYSTGGLRKYFNTGATPAFTYPLGTTGKYTPAVFTVTANSTVGYLQINNVNSTHPGLIDPSNALKYYWQTLSSGVTVLSGSLVTYYMQSDVAGTQETSYMAAKLPIPGTTWTTTAGVDPVGNSITFNYAAANNLSGDYTAGIPAAFFANMPQYTSNSDGNWTDNTIWTQTGGDPFPCPVGGPNGFVVTVNHVVTLNANSCSAYSTTINNKLKVVSPYYGHNLGTVTGSGTLYLESGSFPAGVFTTFLSCAGGSTVEYGGTGTYTIIADLYNSIPKLYLTGTGTRVLPDKDLTICNQLKIDGPVVDNSVYNKKLTIQGTMERYNTGVFTAGSGTVSFAGSAAQTIGGALGDFTGASAFNNFEINNSAGLTVNNTGAIEVKGNLLLTNGLITTGAAATLTISNTSINCVVPAGGSSSSFVSGPVVKKINQYDNFIFPIGTYQAGIGGILGNKLKVSSTQAGPLSWTAQYLNPNPTSGNFTAPLQSVSAQEYWTVGVTAGTQSLLSINWTPTSDITPLVAGGLTNMRLTKYNTGTSKWIEIATTATGDNYNGTAASTGLLTSAGSDNYTLAAITNVVPKAKLSPTGAVCVGTAIPVTFTAPVSIPFDYTLNYSVSGAAQTPVTITSGMVPYSLPTPIPGNYVLTGFTYNSGANTGSVDVTPIVVSPVPTTANAGRDTAICGVTTYTLAGNIPVTGTGLWSIIAGSGGNIISPSSPTSQFIGLNGNVYTLRWTITSGSCTSTDDVIINFTVQPNAPTATSPQAFCSSSSPTVANIAVTPPPACTINWYLVPTGGTPIGSGTALVNGTTYYAESQAGTCTSATRASVVANISADNTITLTSAVGSNNQTVCISNPITTITYSTTGATGATITGLPAGVTGGWAANVVTISGTPTASGPFNYIVTLTGGCGTVTANGTITVSPANSITLSSAAGTDNQTECINTAITNITYSTTTATGATFAGLPSGVTGNWAANVATISGTPTASGTFNYTITLTGGCGAGSASGTIIVSPNNTITLTSGAGSDAQTLCINTAVTNITYATTGATGASVTGLPAGVTGSWAANVVTISGTPTASGTFNYNVTMTGGCGASFATGSITVTPANTITLTSAPGTNAQTACINSAITSITYATTGATGATFTGLPAGVTGNWAANVVTISGTPTASGTFNYTVTMTGGCGGGTATGSITVSPANTITLTSAPGSDAQTKCINTAITSITYATTGATGATFTGLPAGVTGNWAANVVTISGTPTASGTFNYTVTMTGGCGGGTATGTITVTPNNTITLTSAPGTDAQTKCINTAITSITYATTGAAGATFAGLPAGVTGNWAANVVTISGTPTVSGTFNYTVTMTGGCGGGTATGTITVTPANTITLTSAPGTDAQTKCINTIITNITYATTGATGATFSGLPAGVTGNWAAAVVTISGTPTSSGTFNYTVTMTGGCGGGTATGTITVTPANTITLTSAPGTDAQTKCINTAITSITYATTGATGATYSGLPAGVTGNWAANVVTISGTPTASGTFNYTVTMTGGCGGGTATGTITVTPNNTITLTSAPGTDAQTKCINTAITNITYATTGAAGATFAGLPAGVTGNWAANVVTISGTPTVSGTFNYTVTMTGGCGGGTATGTITVTPANTITLISAPGSDAQTKCINTAVTNIIYATTGATGSTFTGLPAGVTGNWAANVVTISGTPTVSGTFNYTVTMTGGCGGGTATGTITVTPNNTITLTSAPGTDTQVKCINTAITSITYATTGATGATYSGLPAGVTGNWAANVVTISGTPTVSGTFNYTVTMTGGCGGGTATGTITVTPNNTITLTSAPGTDAQTKCINTAITNITYATTGATGATFTGLPAGVTGNWAGNVVTISGTPTVSGTFNYTVTMTGGCGGGTANGTITVSPVNTITLTSAPGTDNQTKCISTAITSITYATTGATGATFTALPAGVTGNWAANVVTISGTPTASGTFNYTVTLTGGCGGGTATGTIVVNATNTITLTSAVGTDNQNACQNVAITNITYATTGATGANVTGLPAGVTGSWAANVVSIAGSPTATGTFNYTVTLTGGCGAVSATGKIIVSANPAPVITGSNAVCPNASGIVYSTPLVAGHTYLWAVTGGSISGSATGNTVTINWGAAGIGTLTVTETNATGCVTTTPTYNVTKADVTPPTAVCKNATIYVDNTGNVTLAVTDVDNGSTDNCDPAPSKFLSKTNFTCSDIGASVPVTLTVTDAAGNSGTCISQVTVRDTVKPVIVTKPFTLVLGASGTGTLLPSDIDNGSYDNCGTVNLTVTPNTFTCVDEGTKNVTVQATDSHGNSRSAVIQITVSTSLSVSGVNLSNCDLAGPFASYSATVSGGNGVYSYFWDCLESGVQPFINFDAIPPFFHFASTSTMTSPWFNNLMPDGTYHIRLTVTDGNGCTSSSTMILVKSGILFSNITINYPVACEGGTYTYSVVNDAGATYSWNVTNGTFLTPTNTNSVDVKWNMGVTQGVVAVTKTKNDILGNPCTSQVVDSVTINAVPVPAFNSPVISVCANTEYTYTLTTTYPSYAWTVTGGTVTGGGTAGVNFVKVRWSTGATGKVSVDVTNAASCSGTVFVDVTIYNVQGTITAKTDVSCNGLSDGSVTAAATAGTGLAPYTYSLDGGAYQASGTFSGIGIGNHTVTVRDALLCTFDVPFTISQPTAIVGSISSQTNVSCNGGNDGSVTVTASGGTAPYLYNIDGGAYQASTTFSGLTSGAHTITVQDAHLCTKTVPVNITQPALLTGSIVLQTNVDCNGNSTGAVTVAGAGGTPGYQYSLDGGAYQGLGNFSGLSAGGHSVTVRDTKLCTVIVPVTITQPAILTGAISSQTNVTCNGGNDGQVTIFASGGTSPYQYSLNGGGYQVSATFTGLTAASYTITIRDANLCTTNVPVTITQPAALVATASSNSPVCETGTINLSGGPNGMTSYSWTGPNGFTSTLQNPTIATATLAMGGVYTLTITNASGCTGTANTNVTITPKNTITLTSAGGTDNQTKCINTAITNITYSTTGATGATVAGLPAGVSGVWAANVVTISGTPTASGTFNYTVTLTGGCAVVTATGSIIVTPANTITLTSAPGTDAQTKCINTAITNITYATTGATGATFTGLPAGVTGSWLANVATIS
ncbi:MAG TPA: hypothetical protein VMT63_03495, partial [Bacteroidales bacterium]|nr:hypothetical protein [Bacteroidales bacterium]